MGLKDFSCGFFSHRGSERMLQIFEIKFGGGSSKGVGKKLGLDENLGKWGEPS